jgi:hypothetical protein
MDQEGRASVEHFQGLGNLYLGLFDKRIVSPSSQQMVVLQGRAINYHGTDRNGAARRQRSLDHGQLQHNLYLADAQSAKVCHH